MCVVHRAAAAAVCGGQGGDRQSLLDESSDVLNCLCDQRALSVPVLFDLALPRPFPAHLAVPPLHQPQLSAGRGLRGAALPLIKGGVSCRRPRPLAAPRLMGGRLTLFGLTGRHVVMVTAPRDFGRAVRTEKAKREGGC